MSMISKARILVLVLAAALGLGSLTACSTTMRDLPIPGTGVSGDTIEVKAQFLDALNLAVGAPVKVNGIDMGKVKKIEADDFTAMATLTLKADADLREGATARLRYTTPLGELFVDITNPTSGGEMADGARLELADTTTAPTVENALAQASLLINGGGLKQLQTVTEELNTALGGNEGDFRLLLDQSTVLLTQANATTQSIDKVLTSLNSLSKTLSARETTINRAVREIRPAARVLRRQTPDFTRLLAEVRRFSSAANGTVRVTRKQLLSLLRQVEPVLAEFAGNRANFDKSLRSLIQGAKTADDVIATDYLNISLQLHLDGIQVGGVLEGALADIFDVLGLDLLISNLPLGIDLGGLLGKNRATSGTGTNGSAGNKGSTGKKQPDPLGLSGLLNGLLGGSQ